MAEALTADEVAELVHVIEMQKAEIEEQRAEIARLRSQQSLYDVLREVALDPAVPAHLRVKAAEVGVMYERPRLSASVSMVGGLGIGDRLDRLNGRGDALDRLNKRGMRVIDGDEPTA
jgi:hypothetical protein